MPPFFYTDAGEAACLNPSGSVDPKRAPASISACPSPFTTASSTPASTASSRRRKTQHPARYGSHRCRTHRESIACPIPRSTPATWHIEQVSCELGYSVERTSPTDTVKPIILQRSQPVGLVRRDGRLHRLGWRSCIVGIGPQVPLMITAPIDTLTGMKSTPSLRINVKAGRDRDDRG